MYYHTPVKIMYGSQWESVIGKHSWKNLYLELQLTWEICINTTSRVRNTYQYC